MGAYLPDRLVTSARRAVGSASTTAGVTRRRGSRLARSHHIVIIPFPLSLSLSLCRLSLTVSIHYLSCLWPLVLCCAVAACALPNGVGGADGAGTAHAVAAVGQHRVVPAAPLPAEVQFRVHGFSVAVASAMVYLGVDVVVW